jgi:hypothetical protein
MAMTTMSYGLVAPEQRACIASFLAYLMEQSSVQVDECGCGDDMLKAYEM